MNIDIDNIYNNVSSNDYIREIHNNFSINLEEYKNNDDLINLKDDKLFKHYKNRSLFECRVINKDFFYKIKYPLYNSDTNFQQKNNNINTNISEFKKYIIIVKMNVLKIFKKKYLLYIREDMKKWALYSLILLIIILFVSCSSCVSKENMSNMDDKYIFMIFNTMKTNNQFNLEQYIIEFLKLRKDTIKNMLLRLEDTTFFTILKKETGVSDIKTITEVRTDLNKIHNKMK